MILDTSPSAALADGQGITYVSYVCVCNTTPREDEITTFWATYTYPPPGYPNRNMTYGVTSDGCICTSVGDSANPDQQFDVQVWTEVPNSDAELSRWVSGPMLYTSAGLALNLWCDDNNGMYDVCCCTEGLTNNCAWGYQEVCGRHVAFLQ